MMFTKKASLSANCVLTLTLSMVAFQGVFASMLQRRITDLEKQLPDGEWTAEDIKRMGSGGSHLFQKKGRHVIGYLGDPTGFVCYKGELQENTIIVEKAVRMDSDYHTGEVRSFPDLTDGQKEGGRFERFHPSTYAERFPPYPIQPGSRHEREQIRLSACVEHFGGRIDNKKNE